MIWPLALCLRRWSGARVCVNGLRYWRIPRSVFISMLELMRPDWFFPLLNSSPFSPPSPPGPFPSVRDKGPGARASRVPAGEVGRDNGVHPLGRITAHGSVFVPRLAWHTRALQLVAAVGAEDAGKGEGRMATLKKKSHNNNNNNNAALKE